MTEIKHSFINPIQLNRQLTFQFLVMLLMMALANDYLLLPFRGENLALLTV